MRRALQAVLSRSALTLPQSSRMFIPIILIKPTTFSIAYPTPAHDSSPNLEYDGHWVKLIKDVVGGQSASFSPVNCTGSVAYRTCYNACNSTRWDLFRQKFDTLILKKWEAQAKHGVDPDGTKFLWKVCKFADVPGIGDSDSPYNMDPDLNPTHAFFLLVDEEVIASVLEGPGKGEIPFVYVVDTRYWPPKDCEDEYYEDEYYKRYLKVTV
ncbi:hypothetical protein BCON_0390g00050 [Botryotinia convoluta]|uniref:Uncharacterized protein n=1 Tax=Botryotinia convoluta TaxID=54673 RepID=A0A4Z1HDK5_9HELO|nr:hypothetical protein BCON_0390g00050 [Botryotinia convoluta]